MDVIRWNSRRDRCTHCTRTERDKLCIRSCELPTCVLSHVEVKKLIYNFMIECLQG
jgi:hypothetical protein